MTGHESLAVGTVAFFHPAAHDDTARLRRELDELSSTVSLLQQDRENIHGKLAFYDSNLQETVDQTMESLRGSQKRWQDEIMKRLADLQSNHLEQVLAVAAKKSEPTLSDRLDAIEERLALLEKKCCHSEEHAENLKLALEQSQSDCSLLRAASVVGAPSLVGDQASNTGCDQVDNGRVCKDVEVDLSGKSKEPKLETEVHPEDRDEFQCAIQCAITKYISSHIKGDGLKFDYKLSENVWDASLLLWLPELGTSSSVLLIAALVVNIMIQSYFSFVLALNDSFNTPPFSDSVQEAREWRELHGHSYTDVSVSGVNLVSRVCKLDGSLSQATEQVKMLERINSYLSLQPDDLEHQGTGIGLTLACVCIFVFLLNIIVDLRRVILKIICVWALPSGPTRIVNQKLVQIGHLRMLGTFLLAWLRVSISVVLLYSGANWLAATTSLTELVLNASALSFVIEIDELLFETLVPTKVERLMRRIEPLELGSHTLLAKDPSVTLTLALVIVLMVIVSLLRLEPMKEDMLEVKTMLCGGFQDFYVSQNSQLGVVFSGVSAPFEGLTDHVAVRSVRELIPDRSEHEHHLPPFWWYHDKMVPPSVTGYPEISAWLGNRSSNFQQFVLMGSTEMAAIINQECIDYDKLTAYSGFTSAVHGLYNTKGVPFEPEMFTCWAFRDHCDLDGRNNIMLRAMCPVTCGCDDPVSGLFLGGLAMGCPGGCGSNKRGRHVEMPCTDFDDRNSSNDSTEFDQKAWAWNRYFLGMQNNNNQAFQDELLPKMRVPEGCEDAANISPVWAGRALWSLCFETERMKVFGIASLLGFCPRYCCQHHQICQPSCLQG